MRQIDQGNRVANIVGSACGRIYYHLLSIVDAVTGSVICSQQDIADALGKSERTVREWLFVLEDRGYIQRHERHDPKTGYRLADMIIVVGLKVVQVAAAKMRAAVRKAKTMAKKAAKLVRDTLPEPTGNYPPSKLRVKDIISSDVAESTPFQKLMTEYHNLGCGKFIAKYGYNVYLKCSQEG